MIGAFVIISTISTIAFCRWKHRRSRKRKHRRIKTEMSQLTSMVRQPPAQALFNPHRISRSRSLDANTEADTTSISEASLKTHITGQTHNTLFPQSPPTRFRRLSLGTDVNSSTTTSRMSRLQLSHTLSLLTSSSSLSVEDQVSLLKEKIAELEQRQYHNHPYSVLSHSTGNTLPQYDAITAT